MEKIIKFKLIIPLMLLFVLPLQGSAWYKRSCLEMDYDMQIDKIERIIEKYSSSKYVESVKISPKLLAKLSGAKNTDNLIKNVSGLNILSLKKDSEESRKVCNVFTDEIKDAIKKGYSELITIKSGGDNINIYIEDKNAQVVMLIDNNSEFSVLCIDGSITTDIIQAVMNGDIKMK